MCMCVMCMYQDEHVVVAILCSDIIYSMTYSHCFILSPLLCIAMSGGGIR